MLTDKIRSLGDFIDRVRNLRQRWAHHDHRELWFRGESEKYETFLRPELYRPNSGVPLKPTADLLNIENDLYEDFKRRAVQLAGEDADSEYWHWDSYFLMQHHLAPTRLLDWSDGALIALHFALRGSSRAADKDPIIYVLQPYALKDRLLALPEVKVTRDNWTQYVRKHPGEKLSEDEWEDCYLPADETELTELGIPCAPLALDFPHITRRVAAQRSRFMVFGTDPDWLAETLHSPNSPISEIVIEGGASYRIRLELMDCGITESVIFPDLDGLGREIRQLWNDRR